MLEDREFDYQHVQTQHAPDVVTNECCSQIRMMAEFRKWIEDSKTNQLDKDTEEMIMKLKRHAARRRWRTAKNVLSVGRMLRKKRSSSFESLSSTITSLVTSKSQEGKDIGRAETPDLIVNASLTADQHLIVQVRRE